MFFKHMPPLLLPWLADFFTNDNMTFRTHWMLLFCLLLRQKLYLFLQFDLPRALMVVCAQNFWKTSFPQWWPSGPPPLTFLFNLREGWRSPLSKHEGEKWNQVAWGGRLGILIHLLNCHKWRCGKILCSGELPPWRHLLFGEKLNPDQDQPIIKKIYSGKHFTPVPTPYSAVRCTLFEMDFRHPFYNPTIHTSIIVSAIWSGKSDQSSLIIKSSISAESSHLALDVWGIP